MERNSQSMRRRGVYLLPNLFTTAALFAGFYAVVASMHHDFDLAAIAIFVAMVLDGLDGRVARMTNTQSEFGAEYDSMSDMVSFGIAPALVSYNWALEGLGKIGWLAAFIYTAGAALRLARFNTQIGIADKRFFQGLASPAAAAIVAGMVWLGNDLGINPSLPDFEQSYSPWIPIFAAVLTVGAGLLMVSNFKYHSFKQFDWRGKVPFVVVLVVVLAFVIVATYPALVLFLGFLVYAASGPIVTIRSVKELKMAHVVGDDDDEEDNPAGAPVVPSEPDSEQPPAPRS